MKKLDFTPKNVVNCVDNEITARINYYHWLSFFGSIVLYVSTVSYLCLSLIYCLTHVECFRFFDLAAIIAVPKLHTTTAVHATTISSSFFILRKIGRIYRSHTCGRHKVLSKFAAGFRLAFDMLSTCLRRGLQPGLQLARIMECGIKGVPGQQWRERREGLEGLYV